MGNRDIHNNQHGADWQHLRRASTFGPPPAQRRSDSLQPWILSGRPAGTASANKPAFQPVHAEIAAPTMASRERDAARRRQQALRDKPSPRMQPSYRTGPCEERAIPLTKHAPRQLKTRAERQNPPKWQPSLEWRATHTRPGDETAPFANVPLQGFDPKVVNKCAADFVEAYEDQKQLHGFSLQPSAEPQVRVTGGGWAADYAGPPPLAEREVTSSSWRIAEEVDAWGARTSRARKQSATLAYVDSFLAGPIASAMLPVEAQAWE